MEAKTRSKKMKKHGETIKRRQEYEERLKQHPRVKALRQQKPSGPQKPLKRGVPELIALAIQDPELADSIGAVRRLNNYERKVDDLARRRLKKETISTEVEIKLVREGNEVERGFRKAMEILARKAHQEPATEAYAEAAISNPMPDEILDDLPSHLNNEEQAAMKYLGWGPEHAIWKETARIARQQNRHNPTPGETIEMLKRIENSANQFDYSRAPRHLVKEDILTLGGNSTADELVALFLILLVILWWLIPAIIEGIRDWFCSYFHGRTGIAIC
jgi:hypothetical protein